MSTKIFSREFEYSCEKCDKNVRFLVTFTQFGNDLGPTEDVYRELKGCIGSQQCQVVIDAGQQSRPTYQQWEHCPFYQEIKKYRFRHPQS